VNKKCGDKRLVPAASRPGFFSCSSVRPAVVNSGRQASGVLGVARLGAVVDGENVGSSVVGVLLAGAVPSLAYVRGPQKGCPPGGAKSAYR
jgi:hypothetical protein